VWRLSPDGTYAVVGGSLDGQPFNALFLDDPGVAHPLLEPGIGGVASFQISPDSQYVLAEVIPVGLSEGSSGLVLADPSAPGHGELLLEIPLREGEDELRLEGVGVSPDGTRVVVHADIDETQGLEGVWLDPEVPGEAHHLTDPGVLAQLFHWWFLPDG